MRVRQPIFCHRFHKRLDSALPAIHNDRFFVGGSSSSSRGTFPLGVAQEAKPDSVPPAKVLRASSSLPLGHELRYLTSPVMVQRRPSSMYVTGLPQFQPGAFRQAATTQLPPDESTRLNTLLDTAAHSVKHPSVLRHLLAGEMRVLLDAVSCNSEPPIVLPVRWRLSGLDTTSLASSSTAASSLNTSLASLCTADEPVETEAATSMSFRSSAVSPRWEADTHLHGRWKWLLAEQIRELRASEWSAVPKGIPRETRQSVVTWMSKVIEAMGWPLNSFFIAVHALDYSLGKSAAGERRNTSLMGDQAVPLLSTACVLVGVCAECEHKQMQKARAFVGQVPHVVSVKEIVCKQLAVVADLDRGTLIHKTPLDFLLYYLAAMRLHSDEIEHHRSDKGPPLWDKLFCFWTPRGRADKCSLLPHRCSLLHYSLQLSCAEGHLHPRTRSDPITLLEIVVDGVLVVAIACYLESLHTYLPISRIVAALVFLMLTVVEDSFKDVDFCVGFVRRVFGLDYMADLLPVLTDLFPLLCDLLSRTLGTSSFQRKKTRGADDVPPSPPPPPSNDSAFTTCSPAGHLLLRYLEDVVKLGSAAIPHV